MQDGAGPRGSSQEDKQRESAEAMERSRGGSSGAPQPSSCISRDDLNALNAVIWLTVREEPQGQAVHHSSEPCDHYHHSLAEMVSTG